MTVSPEEITPKEIITETPATETPVTETPAVSQDAPLRVVRPEPEDKAPEGRSIKLPPGFDKLEEEQVLQLMSLGAQTVQRQYEEEQAGFANRAARLEQQERNDIIRMGSQVFDAVYRETMAELSPKTRDQMDAAHAEASRRAHIEMNAAIADAKIDQKLNRYAADTRARQHAKNKFFSDPGNKDLLPYADILEDLIDDKGYSTSNVVPVIRDIVRRIGERITDTNDYDVSDVPRGMSPVTAMQFRRQIKRAGAMENNRGSGGRTRDPKAEEAGIDAALDDMFGPKRSGGGSW